MIFVRIVCAVAALLCSSMTLGAEVTIHWQSGGSYGVFDPAAGMPVGQINGPPPVGQVTTRAGRFLGEVVGTSGIDAEEFYLAPDHFFAYCHDLADVLTNSTYTIAFGASDAVLEFLGAVNSVLPGTTVYDWLNPIDKHVAGAVQLGIWEALYDTGFDLAGGGLTFGKAVDNTMNATMLSHYNAFVAAISQSDALDGQYVMRLTSTSAPSPTTNRIIPGTQDVITGYVPPPREQQLVPEPGTLVLLGFAAAAAALARRRRR